jgi:hypothetical protein
MSKRRKAPRVGTSRDRGFAAQDILNRTRLQDQASVQAHVERIKAAKTINEKRRLLKEIAYYPEHDKRTESHEYHKVHVDLTVTKDLPCLVCGVKHSTLNDPKENPYGARQMETHHHVIEWALANAIDPAKFNKILRPSLSHRHSDPMYQREMTPKEVKGWVDHSPDNLWVLCDVHHRAKYFGIHEISYPIWCPMNLLHPEFEEYVRKQLELASVEIKSKAQARRQKPEKSIAHLGH